MLPRAGRIAVLYNRDDPGKATDEAPTEELRQHFEAMRYTPPVAKRYLVNDTTVEKLGELLNHHPNGLLLFRDELSGWLHTMDRPGHENDRALRSIVRRGIRSVM